MVWLAPENLIAALGFVLLLLEMFFNLSGRCVGRLALVGIIVIFFMALRLPTPGDHATYWSGLCVWDHLAQFFKLFFLATTALVTWMSLSYEAEERAPASEFFIIPLFTASGLLLLASVVDFMSLFVALELVTVSFYILVSYQRHSALALEAGVKYLIMGALASAFLVMGIAYVFGMTGSTLFSTVFARFPEMENKTGLIFGLLLILAGIGFKISAVPFHFWTPDVYEGAPAPVMAFLSVGSKAAGFVLLLRVFTTISGGVGDVFEPTLAWMAGFSLLLGNLAAIPQRNLKRLLAYSSIGHSGYLMLGVLAVSHTHAGLSAIGIYLIGYFLATMTALLVVTVITPKLQSEQIHTYAGLWQRAPLPAAALLVALVSLAGIPPLVGFVGKLTILLAVWESGFIALFCVALVASVIGLYYYLGVVKAMFWSEPIDFSPISVSWPTRVLLVVLMALMIILGCWPQGLALLIAPLV
jgi:NADH-quinone oxidoreductase subunit N